MSNNKDSAQCFGCCANCDGTGRDRNPVMYGGSTCRECHGTGHRHPSAEPIGGKEGAATGMTTNEIIGLIFISDHAAPLRLNGANLAGADLGGALLPGADLSGAYLQGTVLQGADLSRAALQGANLRGADLRAADLSGADLRGADLSGADLRDAETAGADFVGAVLSGAYLPEEHQIELPIGADPR